MKNELKIQQEILQKLDDNVKIEYNPDLQLSLYHSITENLLLSERKFLRMDMSFLVSISSLDYGKKYRVAVISIDSKKSKLDITDTERIIRADFDVLFTTVWQDLILCILPEKLTSSDCISALYQFLQKKRIYLKLACSTIKHNLEDCHYGLNEALRTFDMIKALKISDDDILYYENLGIYRLLYELKDDSVFEAYYNEIFNDIWHYDIQNNTHLFETLESYFLNECDKAKTAKELFIHGNTLRYRLKQIEDIIGKDLKNVNVITEIVTALKIRRMILILDN